MANESSGKKALKAGLGYTVGNMLVKGLSFLAIPLFARLMTVEDFGIYSTFSSYVMIMTVLAGFTLHTSVRNAKLDYVDLTGSYCSSVTLLVIGNSLLLLALSLVFAAPLARSLSQSLSFFLMMVEAEYFLPPFFRAAGPVPEPGAAVSSGADRAGELRHGHADLLQLRPFGGL